LKKSSSVSVISNEVIELKLSKPAFVHAHEFIHTHARPIDLRLFQYYFEGGTKESVLEELVKYQNPDGGFGNAIEPDFRLKASSPMATSIAFQYCIKVDIFPENPLIEPAIEYLMSMYESENGYWPATSLEVNEEPHAPWWHVEKISPPSDEKWANPSAELFGYLHKFSEYVPQEFLTQVSSRVYSNLNNITLIEGIYNILCWQRAYYYLPEPLKSMVKERLDNAFSKIKPITSDFLNEVRIFWLTPSPNAVLLFNPGNIHGLFDQEIERQAKDGGWWPTWKWGQYEDSWKIAEKEWAGKITVHCLIALKKFKLIED
jgi:hypothetical protein